jgi:hypothetical protein
MKNYLTTAAILLFGAAYLVTNRYEMVPTFSPAAVYVRDRWSGHLSGNLMLCRPAHMDSEKFRARVDEARKAGYTDEEIKQFTAGGVYETTCQTAWPGNGN